MVDLTQAEPQRSAFVGRRRELAELLEALEGGADSQRHLFQISGEPGIGKTRLVDEVAAGARDRGVRVVWGRCWEGEGAPAYWPWIQVLRASLSEVEPEQRRALLESEVTPHIAHDVAQIVPELRPALLEGPRPSATTQLDPEQARFRLFDSVTNLLKNFARSKAMLIVLDDLHDGDQASLMMLRFVARELAGASILLVGTYRDVEVRRSRPLGKLIGEISREARSIPLAGLSEAEVANFVESLAGQRFDDKLVARLYAATNGNPLFIDGIVRVLIAQGGALHEGDLDAPFRIPGGVREAIHLRLDRLSPQTNAILSVGAAIGNEFEVRRCQLVAGTPADQLHPLLDEAAGTDVVTRLGYGRYRFSHALIREALYGDIDTNTRIALHGKIGAVTEELYRDDLEPHLAELAHHFGEAGIADKAIDYCVRAADAANAVFAYDAVISHMERALAIGESHGADASRRAAVLSRLGAGRFFFLEMAQGIEDMEAALRLYQQLGDSANSLELHSFLGVALAGLGLHLNLQRAQNHYREAATLVSADTNPQLVARINYGLAITATALARYDEALSASARAVETYERLGMGEQAAWVTAAKDRVLHLMFKGRHAQAVALEQRVFDVASALSDPDTYGWAMLCIGLYRLQMRDPRQASRLFRLGLEKSGVPPRCRGLLTDFLAMAMLDIGRLAESETLAKGSINTIVLGLLALQKGEWQSPPKLLRESVEWARNTGNRTDQMTLPLLSLLCWFGSLETTKKRPPSSPRF
jgi:eukaryotic-like serine/threonine-protein kinase